MTPPVAPSDSGRAVPAHPWRLAGDALAAHGDAVALESRTAQLSYADLAGRAAAVWRSLRRVGVLPGDAVAVVSVGRGHDEAVALAGALTSGAVAVPLDATAPPLRLAQIAQARSVRAVIADAASAKLLDAVDAAEPSWVLPRVVLDERGVSAGTTAGSLPAPRETQRDHEAATVLHTSGSTGTPKPVPITWAGLDAFTSWAASLVGLRPGDRVLRVAELVFDLAWFDHLATWRTGATLVTMSRRDLAAGRAALDALTALGPTVLYTVPSLLSRMVAALKPDEALPASLRAVLFAGEVFAPRELAALSERLAPAAQLFNLYGPTETNVCTFHHVDRAALDGERETPIGVSCPYARCTLGADDGTTVDGPGVGELVVEGPTTVGGRPYATRDRVERGRDGLFYFRGRIDRMVKIRGYRVEPGEVEAALVRHPAVRAAAVLPRDDARLGRTLHAFVAARAGETIDERAVRAYLAQRLPPYMVPERVIVLDDLPTTTTGKTDYAALGTREGR